MTGVTVNIDAVTLDGVPIEQRAAVMAAFRSELALALSQGETLTAAGRSAASTIEVPLVHPRGPEAIGRAMARRLIEGRP